MVVVLVAVELVVLVCGGNKSGEGCGDEADGDHSC